MSKNTTTPGYQEFRDEIDALYPPAVAGRIAVRRHATKLAAGLVYTDLREQISPEIIAVLARNEYDMLPASVSEWHHDPDMLLDWGSLHSGYIDKLVSYIVTPEKRISGQSHFRRMLVDPRSEPATLVFNRSSVMPGLHDWFSFYHELCHSLISIEAHKYDRNHSYYQAMEESVCESFAAIMLFRKMGKKCLPYLDTHADIRLANFLLSGPEYFAAPAIRSIVSDIRGGKGELFRMLDYQGVFEKSVETAFEHFLNAAGVIRFMESAYGLDEGQTEHTQDDIRDIFENFFGIKSDGPDRGLHEVRTHSDQTMRSYLVESRSVLDKYRMRPAL